MKKRSNRQIGVKPKVSKTIRIDAELYEKLVARSRYEGFSQIAILEAALKQYLEQQQNSIS